MIKSSTTWHNIEKFLSDGLPKLKQIVDELKEGEGCCRSLMIKVLPGVDRLSISYRNGVLEFWRPMCLGCQFLEAEYQKSPCKFCNVYRDKPGKHRGRPSYSSTTKLGVSTDFDDFSQAIPKKQVVDFA